MLRYVFVIMVAACLLACSRGTEEKQSPSPPRVAMDLSERVPTVGFEQVTGANDGQYITLTEHIDIKYLCMDLSPTQREICTTSLVNADHQPYHIIEIRLRVCSEEIRRNCIVFDSDPQNVDFRNVYVLDDDGQAIDFDGERLINPPNTWTSDPVKLKLTGRVTVANGKGKLLEPIEKIERP